LTDQCTWDKMSVLFPGLFCCELWRGMSKCGSFWHPVAIYRSWGKSSGELWKW